MSEEKDNHSALKPLENLRMRLLVLTCSQQSDKLLIYQKGSLRIINELPE